MLILLLDAAVALELNKRVFFTNSINFLGHVTRPRRLEIASYTSDTILDLKSYTTVIKRKFFLDYELCADDLSPILHVLRRLSTKNSGTTNRQGLENSLKK